MSFGGGGGRSALQPEIVEAIRSLDVPALRLNNLSFDGSTDPKGERNHAEEEPLTPGHDHEDSVVLRRKVNCLERKAHSLYERRLPRVPKLHLLVAGKKNPPTEEEEFRTFQVAFSIQLSSQDQLFRSALALALAWPSICRLSRVLCRVVIHFRLHFHSSD